MKRKNKMKQSRGDKIFVIVNYTLLTVILLLCLYPLWFVIISSVSNPDLVNSGKVWLLPKEISFTGYKNLFNDKSIIRGYINTLIYTGGGTLLNLAVTLPAAYALSRKDFVGRKFFTLMFLFTMFFSGGLIPTFMTVKNLGLYNNPWVMVILGATSMTNIIISRTFFMTNIPNELHEAAQIDGCGNVRLFLQVVLPISTAICAVMALFFAVNHWNGYFTALIYIRDDRYKPLQIIMREVLMRSQFNAEMLQQGGDSAGLLQEELKAAEQIKYALIVVASLPVMAIYPFIQKYFVKGVTVGAVKG
ncbi:MAG TPA: sugar ABC transporter permease [Lachnoclostridium phytofermentans]|uniref:Sugar ABC transporter permease n=1 Tax=Lachnoclostridium phytofermentans TaxID=66219 RepID=A0A3D2X306_9FIRM|nr:carbohydrate ABC transporter permease [Lachnoclostridium sp.]HCL01274.1 sugar ABC transporter permease [Lachnoclostridium phytofermentans]